MDMSQSMESNTVDNLRVVLDELYFIYRAVHDELNSIYGIVRDELYSIYKVVRDELIALEAAFKIR